MTDQERLPIDKNGTLLKIGDKIKKTVCLDPDFLFTVTDIQEGYICINSQILYFKSEDFYLTNYNHETNSKTGKRKGYLLCRLG